MIECSRCASRNGTSDVFCGSCGSYLGWAGRTIVIDSAAAFVVTDATASAAASGGARTLAVTVADTHGRVCPNCTRVNRWERRFCGRCGHRLVHSDDLIEPYRSSEVVVPPWWQWVAFWRWPRGDRVHPAGTRPDERPTRPGLPEPPPDALPTGGRAGRWLRVTLRRDWPDVLLVVLVVALIVMLVPSLSRAVVDAVRDRTTPLPTARPISCDEPSPRADLLPAFPAAFACDGQAQTGWVTPFSSKYSTPELIITLAHTDSGAAVPAAGVDLAAFQFTASVPPPEYAVATASGAATTGRPAALQLDFYTTENLPGALPSGSPVRTVKFLPNGGKYSQPKDTSDTQRWSFSPCVAAIKTVVITVTQVYPDPVAHAAAANVYVNEVQFFKPRSPCNQA